MDHLFKYARVETRSGVETLLKNYKAAASVASNVEGKMSNLPHIIFILIKLFIIFYPIFRLQGQLCYLSAYQTFGMQG